MRTRIALVLAVILTCVSIGVIPSASVQAQSPACSSYSFPRGNWYVGGASTTITGDAIYTNWGGQNYIYAILSFPTIQNIYSVTVSWNPGEIGFNTWSKMVVATNMQDSSGVTLIETRQFPYNDNRNVTFTFNFSKTANRVDIQLNSGTTLIPANITGVIICMAGGIPPAPTATTAPSSTVAGGPTLTNTPVPTNSKTPTSSFTPSNTPANTATPGTPTATNTGGPSPTPGAGTPLTANGGLFSPIPPPLACNDILNPCGVNPFMPNGIATIPPVVINTIVPVTSVNTVSPPTLIIQSTSTGTITTTPTVTGTVTASVVDGIASYATGIAGLGSNGGAGSGLSGTPGNSMGLLGIDHSTVLDAANSGNQIGSHIGDLFGVVRSSGGWFLGKLGAILAFILLIVGFVITWWLLWWLLPIIVRLFDLLLQLIQALVPW